jgi:hypothetical protein
MGDRVERPSFLEGQILRAADLALDVDYARGQLARHERYLHTPGIAAGLDLTVDKSTGVTQVKVAPGVAVDATGREIVVEAEETLAPEDLDRLGVLIPADTDATVKQEERPWHPVFLVGRDEDAATPALGRGCGAARAGGRTTETYEVQFGRPGDGEDPPAVEVSDGPGSAEAVRVLIGFVQWDGGTGFADAKAAPQPGLSARYAGARADEVVARSGALALRADLGPTRDKRPALVLDGDQGGELRFGLQDAKGEVNEVFTVTAAGDLTVAGKIKSLVATGVLVESGTVTDGMLVPLPVGVTQQQLDDGKIALHLVLTPRLSSELQPPGSTTGTWIRQPHECRADGRRVFVRERWFEVTSLATLAAPKLVSAACDYVALAYVTGAAP